MPHEFRLLLVAVVGVCLSACAADPAPVVLDTNDDLYIEPIVPRLQELQIDSYIDKVLPVESYAHPGSWDGAADWTVYRYGAGASAATRCFDGGEYFVSERKASSKRLAIYTEGGGACWSYESCYVWPFFVKQDSSPIPQGRATQGIMNRTHPDAVMPDHSVLYGSYCDGSVWTGDNTVSYHSITDGTVRETYHWGMRNVSALATLARQNYPEAEDILIFGDSAGGYGTMMSSLVMRLAFPQAKITILNDSGPWLFNRDEAWMVDAIYDNWDVRRIVPDDCGPRCDEQLLYFLEWGFPRDPSLRVGLFMHYDDFTIGASYLMYGLDFREVLLETTQQVADQFPQRFKRYFTDGIRHTIISSDDMYDVENHGQPLHAWMRGLIDDTDTWQDQAYTPERPGGIGH